MEITLNERFSHHNLGYRGNKIQRILRKSSAPEFRLVVLVWRDSWNLAPHFVKLIHKFSKLFSSSLYIVLKLIHICLVVKCIYKNWKNFEKY